MNHDQLIARLEQHYPAKRELISRIPLGVQLEPLWQDILARRRARATMLPLHNPSGQPYWYVTTDAMIAASEKIIEAVYENDDAVPEQTDKVGDDIPNFKLSSIEEVFFTSFVEGSPMKLEDAMNFLQSGEAPHDIEEQIIVNNRLAALFAEQNLTGDIDSDFIQQLNGILTNGLDNGGTNYRAVDHAAIPYLGQEPYRVAPAAVLPDRVNEFIAFINSMGDTTHPLIKAAITHVWILITRPFPEGNERLGRLLSSFLLLRSGYSIFSGVSFSALIARRTYTYYSALANVLRDENGGDLTYFIEYYLDLLVKGLAKRKVSDTPMPGWEPQQLAIATEENQLAAGAEERMAVPFDGMVATAKEAPPEALSPECKEAIKERLEAEKAKYAVEQYERQNCVCAYLLKLLKNDSLTFMASDIIREYPQLEKWAVRNAITRYLHLKMLVVEVCNTGIRERTLRFNENYLNLPDSVAEPSDGGTTLYSARKGEPEACDVKAIIESAAQKGPFARLTEVVYTDLDWLMINENFVKIQNDQTLKMSQKREAIWQVIDLFIKERVHAFCSGAVSTALLMRAIAEGATDDELNVVKQWQVSDTLRVLVDRGFLCRAIPVEDSSRIIYYFKPMDAETVDLLEKYPRIPEDTLPVKNGLNQTFAAGELLCSDTVAVPNFIKYFYLLYCKQEADEPVYKTAAINVLDLLKKGVYEKTWSELTKHNEGGHFNRHVSCTCAYRFNKMGIIYKAYQVGSDWRYHIDVQIPEGTELDSPAEFAERILSKSCPRINVHNDAA